MFRKTTQQNISKQWIPLLVACAQGTGKNLCMAIAGPGVALCCCCIKDRSQMFPSTHVLRKDFVGGTRKIAERHIEFFCLRKAATPFRERLGWHLVGAVATDIDIKSLSLSLNGLQDHQNKIQSHASFAPRYHADVTCQCRRPGKSCEVCFAERGCGSFQPHSTVYSFCCLAFLKLGGIMYILSLHGFSSDVLRSGTAKRNRVDSSK